MRTTIATIVISTLLLVQTACRQSGDNVELIAGLEGGMSVIQAQDVAKRGDRNWLLVNDGSARAGHTYQRWHVVPFQDRNFAGEAELDFYDAHLVRVSFFARDARQYLDQLSAELDIPLNREVRAPNDDRVTIWTGTDYRGKLYAAWEDRKLREELDAFAD